jgi:glyoxylase-like metal-dependent hydrolase (beta-lactamase superfamily II)
MLKIGQVEVSRVEEIVLHEQTTLLAEWTDATLAQHRDLMVPNFYDVEVGAFRVNIQSWLLKTPSQTILIDTCGGNHKDRPASPRFHQLNTPYLDRLQAAGVSPADISIVICTHLHIDHVGWNTHLVDGKWVPTFPNAKYVFPRIEVEWRDPARGAREKPHAANLPFIDSVQPILDAGMAMLVEGNERFSDEIDFIPTPGHAPGMMAVRLRSGGKEALFVADVTHLPIQVYHPNWSTKYCEDQVLAAQTRRRVFEYLADNRSLMFPGHYNHPHGGYLTRRDNGFIFTPTERVP